MNWEAWKPLATLVFTSALKFVGGLLVAHGLATNGPGLEALGGAATTAAGALWSWWVQKGHIQAADYLKKMTDTATQAAAIEVAKRLPVSSAPSNAVQTAKASAIVAAPAVMAKDASVDLPTTIVKILLVAFALALFLPATPGHAQVKLGPVAQKIANDLAGQATDKSASAVSNIAAVLAKPFKDIADFIGADATSAIALSTVIPALQDGHGQQCWMAMKSFGDVIQAHPVPITFHVINDYETLRLLGIATNNLCSNVHCTQVFADATAMAQAASPIPLAIPSLHDLCTKVPQIAVVAPVPVPASPPATPAVEPK